mgnify:CR=1 FL=1|jgi:hypothetical protein
MAYKIGEKAVLIESGGQSVLIVKELSFGVDGTDSAGDFITAAGGSVPKSFTLSDNFINNYFPFVFQGTTSGYVSGGGPPSINEIEKFSFSSDGNGSDVGDLTRGGQAAAGTSSKTHGYTSGGNAPPRSNVIDKFPFSSDGNASDVGDLTQARDHLSGQSSETHGYVSGGNAYPSPHSNIIEKFTVASDANASDVGDLLSIGYGFAGQNSATHGYVSGGAGPSFPTYSNVIQKFSFSVDGNATDVGDLTQNRFYVTGQSSENHGYTTSGAVHPTVDASGYSNIIDKFPFASDGNASDVGDLTASARGNASGQSSTTHGYTSGGGSPVVDTIDKFSFSVDGNATDVGELTSAKHRTAGQQV